MTFTVTFIEEPTNITAVDEDTFTVAFADDTADVFVSDTAAQGPPGPIGPPGGLPMFTRSGQIEPLVGVSRLYIEYPFTITRARASLGTPSVGADVVVDVKRNGASILGATKIVVPAGQNTHTKDLSVAVAANDYLTVDIDSVGSTTPGSDLTVTITLE